MRIGSTRLFLFSTFGSFFYHGVTTVVLYRSKTYLEIQLRKNFLLKKHFYLRARQRVRQDFESLSLLGGRNRRIPRL